LPDGKRTGEPWATESEQDVSERRPQYIDEVVCLDVNQDADTDPLEGGDTRYYVHQGERSEQGRRAWRHEVASGDRIGGPCPQEASRMRVTGGATWNVIFLTDESGAIPEYYRYDPYGRRHIFVADDDGNGLAFGHQVLASTVGNVIGHKGRWHEPATGLIENRARFNNPRIGRWMQRDPLGYVDGLSLYAYVQSNPVIGNDPSGFVACLCRCPVWPFPPTCWTAAPCLGKAVGNTCTFGICRNLGTCIFGACCGCS